jgi:serine/threonine protein kinase
MASIESGTQIGSFEVLAPLGAGGQGEVYKARDVRLDRLVAIKILPKHIATDPERKQRFEREAQTVAKLNHAHICVLHDVGRHEGLDYLVMEFLDGETLAERLNRGPLPLNQALELAIQIGDALDKAHRQGVVHRDVKPGNIMITKSGAKLMDFGLAKKREAGGLLPASEVATGADITAQGVILGTLQYMAPEQLEGREADARSDVWGFGSVLYEMITGKKAFEGKSQVSLIAAILEHEPAPIRAMQPLSPARLEHIVKRCVAKDPDRRWQTLRDIVLELQSLGDHDVTATVGPTPDVAKLQRSARYGWWAAAILGVVAMGFALFPLFTSTKPDVSVTRFNIYPPKGTSFFDYSAPLSFDALSPDGRKLAFITNTPGGASKLWVQPLDALEPQVFSGVEGVANPFWSTDSRQIAFFAQTKLMVVDATGGPPLVVSDGYTALPGAWLPNREILFTPSLGPLFRISSGGGTPTAVTTLDKEARMGVHVLPQLLPDGRHFFYRVPQDPQFFATEATAPLVVADLKSKETKRVGNLPARTTYASPGFLLFVRDKTLMAQRFDLEKFEVTGEASRIADGVSTFSVSNNGVLAYRAGVPLAATTVQVTWFDRQGKQTPLKELAPADFSNIELSPDGKRFAIARLSGTLSIWLYDLARGITSRFTFGDNYDSDPRWSPDGDYISFSRTSVGPSYFTGFYRKNSNGAGDEELLGKFDGLGRIEDASPDGRSMLYGMSTLQKSALDLSFLPLEGDKKPRPFLQTEFNEKDARFSPNGKWVAYASNQSGRFEIYIRASSPDSALWQISKDGALQPRWRRDGKELFYLSLDGKMMAIPIEEVANAIQPGAAQSLFDTKIILPTGDVVPPGSDYAVTPDGQRFLVLLRVAAPNAAALPVEPIHVILNWPALLKK